MSTCFMLQLSAQKILFHYIFLFEFSFSAGDENLNSELRCSFFIFFIINVVVDDDEKI